MISPDFVLSKISRRFINLLHNKALALYLLYKEKKKNKKYRFCLDLAAKHIDLSIEFLNTVLYRTQNESSVQFIIEEEVNVFNTAIQIALEKDKLKSSNMGEVKDKQLSKAYAYCQNSQAITLLKSLKMAAVYQKLNTPHHKDLLEKKEELKGEILKFKKNNQAFINDPAQSEKDKIKLRIELNELQIAYLNIEKEILISRPEAYKINYRFYIQTEYLQNNLAEKEALLNFYCGEKETYLFVLTNKNINCFRLKAAKKYEKTIKKMLDAIQFIDKKEFIKYGKKLYQTLLKDALKYLRELNPEIDKLIIIPHQSLYTLPFEALLQDTDSGMSFQELPYLINRYQIVYHYSASLWHFKKTQFVGGNTDVGLTVSKNASPPPKAAFSGFAPVYNPVGEKADFSTMPEMQNTIDISQHINRNNTREIDIAGQSFKALLYSEAEVIKVAGLWANLG